MDEARPAGPDPERDRRRDAYRDRERRKATRLLDRLLDVHLNGGAGEAYADVAGERFVEAVGDYVLARIGDSIESELGPSAARDVLARVSAMLPDGFTAEINTDPIHQKAHYGVADLRVTDASAVHVPHRHLGDGSACSSVDCHSLEGKPCTYCGGQPCRVVLE